MQLIKKSDRLLHSGVFGKVYFLLVFGVGWNCVCIGVLIVDVYLTASQLTLKIIYECSANAKCDLERRCMIWLYSPLTHWAQTIQREKNSRRANPSETAIVCSLAFQPKNGAVCVCLKSDFGFKLQTTTMNDERAKRLKGKTVSSHLFRFTNCLWLFHTSRHQFYHLRCRCIERRC